MVIGFGAKKKTAIKLDVLILLNFPKMGMIFFIMIMSALCQIGNGIGPHIKSPSQGSLFF